MQLYSKPAMPKKSPRRKMSAQALELVAQRFKVLGEPTRLRLLVALEAGEQNVTSLVEAAQSTQANVSKHLGILLDAGMVSRRKEGLNAFYLIADPRLFELCDLMCRRLEQEFAKKKSHFRK